MFEVRQYETEEGTCPFADWFDSLGTEAAYRVEVAIERMSNGNLGDHKAVGDGVQEHRIHHGPGYRLYFGRDGQQIVVLLVGGTKKCQARDVAAAKRSWRNYKERKRSRRQWH